MKHFLKIIFLVFVGLVLTVSIQSEPAEGILKEFRETEEAIINKKTSKEIRQQTLESNLLSAMRLAIKRRYYHEQVELLKDLNEKTLAYEKHPATNLTIFVRYKTYYARFDFYRDPEIFYQAPYMDKFLTKEDDADAHKTKPADG